MNFRRLFWIISLVLIVSAFVAPTLAQESIIDGLRNPRNLSYDSNGSLYIAEAGVAGSELTDSDAPFGATSRILRISADGNVSVVLKGLISYRAGDTLGAHAVEVTDESIWVVLGETSDFTIPFTHALVEFDKETGRVKRFIDLLTLELTEDPDGNPNQQSNAVDMAIAPDGSILIANAGCNCLMSWSEADGLSVAVAWDFETDNPVPTSVEIGPDGDIYVGFLTGFPFPEGGARIERWSGGELVQTYGGLTAVTSLVVADDGTIYAVERGVFDMAVGWGAGRVVRVDESGVTPILEGLTLPYGIAQASDGTLVVSVGSAGGEDGEILIVPMQ